MRIKIPEKFEGKRYIGLFDSWEQFIMDDGYRYYGMTMAAADKLEDLHNFMQSADIGNFDKGYIWNSSDINENPPLLVVERHVDEETNTRTNELELFSYAEVREYTDHNWKQVEFFREVAADVQEHGGLNEVLVEQSLN